MTLFLGTRARRQAVSTPVSGSAMALRDFNRLPPETARELLHDCLPAARWVDAVLEAGPFRGLEDLFEVARDAAPLTPAELEAVLAYRPPPVVVPPTRPGETPLELRLRQQLAAGVALYEQRFGRPFLIRTEGRLPAQVLVQLWTRLTHELDTEDLVVAQQLRESALIRLADLVHA